jgi:hypothetical protein
VKKKQGVLFQLHAPYWLHSSVQVGEARGEFGKVNAHLGQLIPRSTIARETRSLLSAGGILALRGHGPPEFGNGSYWLLYDTGRHRDSY